MILNSSRKIFVLLLLLAVVVMTIWWVFGGKQGESLPPWFGWHASQKNEIPSAISGTASDSFKTPPNVRPLAIGTARNESGSGSRYSEARLFNESARSLLRSAEIAKVDYALLRLKTRCIAFPAVGDPTEAVRARGLSLVQVRGADALVVGNATEEIRAAGFSQSLDRCSAYFEGVTLSDHELASIRTLPGVSEVLTIMRKLSAAVDFDDGSAKAALSQAVAGPMLGTLESLILSKVDYGALASAYSKEQVESLRALVADILLCRMGDDCARGGIVNTQLCWENGICGDNAEEAIWANLRDRGLDTTALNQFVTRVHQALIAGDTSIFRKPKPTK